jgi:hypothetical protein
MMATLTSSPATLSVISFPYSLPTSAGQVVSIGTNTASSVRPNTHSVFDWEWSLFGYFGGGVFIPNFSQGGAYVFAGTGGHEVPPNYGAAIFDFQDATWKRKDNANNVPHSRIDPHPDQIIYPYGEIVGASPPGIPAPSHNYATARPMHVGGGALGSVLHLVSIWQGVNPANGYTVGSSYYSHAMNLQTGLWTRVSTNAVIGARHAYPEGEFFSSAYDAATNRYYIIHRFEGGHPLGYLDGNDWTWKRHAVTFPFAGGGYTQGCFIDDARHMLVVTVWAPYAQFGLNLNNPAGGWTQLSVSGPGDSINNQMQWALYPPNGCYYLRHDNGGSTLYKLQPPPPNPNPFAGTWTVSTITLNQSLPSPQPDWYSQGAFSHNRLFYVPSIQCLAWIADGSQLVRLIKPF